MAIFQIIRAKLDAWYESLRPLKVDLVGDFAGKELFAIHGDALMLHCIHEAGVDLTDGFQIVHAIHAVETCLQKLKQRGCNFHVVWFQDQERLCLPGGHELPVEVANKHLLIRAILVRHLPCFEFSSIHDAAFTQSYLNNNAIHFFLCLDPKVFAPLSGKPASYSHLSILHEFCTLGTKGYSIAFINGAKFVSSKVYCSVVSPSSSWEPFPLLLPKTVKEDSGTKGYPPSKVEDRIRIQLENWTPWEDRSPLTSREVTAVHTLCALAQTTAIQDLDYWSTQYLVHLALLRRLPLSRRSFDVVSNGDMRLETFLSEFSSVCKSILPRIPKNLVWDSFDLLDGRLLGRLSQRPQLRESVVREVSRFADKVKEIVGVCDVELSPDITYYRDPPQRTTPHLVQTPTTDDRGVLPFSHPVLDRYLREVHVQSTLDSGRAAAPRFFQELTHWHNARVSIDAKKLPQPKTARQMKSDQKWMAVFIQYSASLNNATGKTIDPEIIVVGSEIPIQQPATNQPQPTTSKNATSNNKKAKPKSGRQLALEAAEVRRKEKAGVKANNAMTLWKDQRKLLDQDDNLIRRYSKVAKYLNSILSEVRCTVGAEATLYAYNTLGSILQKAETVDRSTDLTKHNIAALRWSLIQDLDKLGKKTGPADVPADVNFQLRYCGPLLERSFDSAPDPRVPFHPDAWQRKVLDAIDADKSLFVIAPTSAGKTFISFYAMKKVLKTSDDGVLVYVAPTKALVNQIAAEIQARFTKTYSKLKGKSVWAIHTRDYRINNPIGCQILVTVPHILQIMLLAPSNAQHQNSWARRVRRIIFDEVHCIGQTEEGVIWEQLLLLSPCPIIALSATVGNPLEFKAWLEASEKAKGRDLTMIVHKTRYSDLRKFLWEPPAESRFTGLQPVERLPIAGLDDGMDTGSRFSWVHPVASIVNRVRGTMDDLSLEPRDCITLWASMAKHQTKAYPLDPALQPSRAIVSHESPKDDKPVRKAEVIEYETKLKEVLQEWMKDRDSPFDAVRESLRFPYEMSEFSAEDLRKNALSLLTDLRKQGALPAILFQYDRGNCEDIAFEVLSQLTEAEDNWKASSTKWQKKMEEFEKWKKEGKKAQVLKEKATKAKAKAKGRKGDDDDVADGRREEDPDAWTSFDPEAPLPMFSLADSTRFSSSELEEVIRALKFKNIDARLIGALRRGVAVHHAGMNLKYRQVVEMLFRKGFLTAVVATGTLALGINMPCKTVVFYGDSVFLTALNYHQAAGRAGRRGFDLLGNVVFAGMSQERAYEIMSSRLPDLRGHFPLSTTLILRILGLLHHTQNSEFATRAAKSLLLQTRLYLGGPEGQSIKHHARFSIDYLRKQHLLASDGAPLNFAGLVGHLYFTENAVFAFHSLLSQGYFHDLCTSHQVLSDETLLEVVLVLSHIFGRFPVGHISDEWRETIHRSPSVVLLPPLPDAALRILRNHNANTLTIFKDYANTFVDQHLADKPDRNLPFTGAGVGRPEHEYWEEDLHQSLGSLAPTRLRSPFAALSGFSDDSFHSIHELCSSARDGLFLEESAIPFIPIDPDDTSGPWNAYLYDFFKHGDMKALVRDNHVKRGDVWSHLKDFSLVLATIVTSLRNFMSLETSDDDLAMMDVQDAEDASREQEDENLYADEGPETSVAPVTDKPKVKQLKKAVAASWEDDSDIEEVEVMVGEEDDSSSDESGSNGPAWDEDGGHKLPKILAMFVRIQQEFDTKFKAIWA